MQPVRLRIAQDTQGFVDEYVRLGQALFRCTKARKRPGPYQHAVVDSLDEDILPIKGLA